jgi:hypothetical protein
MPERQISTYRRLAEDSLNLGAGPARIGGNQPLVSGPARVIVILTMTRRSRRMASR